MIITTDRQFSQCALHHDILVIVIVKLRKSIIVLKEQKDENQLVMREMHVMIEMQIRLMMSWMQHDVRVYDDLHQSMEYVEQLMV